MCDKSLLINTLHIYTCIYVCLSVCMSVCMCIMAVCGTCISVSVNPCMYMNMGEQHINMSVQKEDLSFLPSAPTGQDGALVGASKRSKMVGSAFIIEIENPIASNYWSQQYELGIRFTVEFCRKLPAISREVINDPV